MRNEELYIDMLQCVSTSGEERALAMLLSERMKRPDNRVEMMEVGDGTLNLLISWGEPRLLFCTHMDTVPPYIAPRKEGGRYYGRGTCDAKGQIVSMWNACVELAERGETGFGLLLLAGEETGSFGAKAFTQTGREYEYVVVGEPTDNKMVSASKGTKSFVLEFEGISCHSGYPEEGRSAVMGLYGLMQELQEHPFPVDERMGETTWNIGELHADNKQNILAGTCRCRIYFRTTEASDTLVGERMEALGKKYHAKVEAKGGDTPMRYMTLPEAETITVAFGSDAPQLHHCAKRMLCGPGSILVAHRDSEQVSEQELVEATERYKRIFEYTKIC